MPRGARRLPDACVERLRSADLIVHAGDVSRLSVLEELRSLGPPVRAVFGNADEPALRESLPERVVVEAGGARIRVVHDPGARGGREGGGVSWLPGVRAVGVGGTRPP